MKIHPVGAESFHAGGRTGRYDKPNSRSSQFCESAYKDRTWKLRDVAIPTDRNVTQKEAEKKLKYKSLCMEIRRMWNMKCMIIPVIIGATGMAAEDS